MFMINSNLYNTVKGMHTEDNYILYIVVHDRTMVGDNAGCLPHVMGSTSL